MLSASTKSSAEKNQEILCTWQNHIQNNLMSLDNAGLDTTSNWAALAQVIKVVENSDDLRVTEADLNELYASLI